MCYVAFVKSIGVVGFCATLSLLAQPTSAIPLDITSHDSIKAAALTAAQGMIAWYTGNKPGGTPGLLPGPYYWWEGGAMMMSLINYWTYTEDAQYNSLVTQGILWQVGPNVDFMTPNETKSTGNDDQAFWGMAAMTAAETLFPNPPAGSPQWLALAQAVFNDQAGRWDTTSCAGGLKWQVFPFNTGYDYKNAISQGCFFNIASRLARYTRNQTYADWAEKAWDWSYRVGLISPTLNYFDGTDDTLNCSQVNHNEWTYNAGVFLYGAANMYDYTKDDIWKDRVWGTLTNMTLFFNDNNVMQEWECESLATCNFDQRSFKAYLSQWMAGTTTLVPETYDYVMQKLTASAVAAAQQCSGGADGTTCGLRWTLNTTWDGSSGVGEQMAAMSVISALLVTQAQVPVTNSTGGTSVGNPSAGTGGDDSVLLATGKSTKVDKAGGGILTVLFGGAIIGGAVWMAF